MEADPNLFENDEKKFSILKKSDSARLEIFADLLGSHLGIVVRKQHEAVQPVYQSAFFLGRHDVSNTVYQKFTCEV